MPLRAISLRLDVDRGIVRAARVVGLTSRRVERHVRRSAGHLYHRLA